MKRKIITIVIMSITFLFCSCTKKNRVESLTFRLPSFSEIELYNPFWVYLQEDSLCSIEIVANEDIIGDISVEVEDHILKIRNESRLKMLTPTKNKIELYINSPPLSRVTAQETCNINTLNPITSDEFGLILKSKANEANLELDCQNFYYWNNFPCGGKVILSGTTDKLILWNFALMAIDAKNVVTRYARVENSSKGSCEVTVTEEIKYSISNTGDIHLYGSPPIITELQVTSSGRLIQH